MALQANMSTQAVAPTRPSATGDLKGNEEPQKGGQISEAPHRRHMGSMALGETPFCDPKRAELGGCGAAVGQQSRGVSVSGDHLLLRPVSFSKWPSRR
jgi:hypothetical protein